MKHSAWQFTKKVGANTLIIALLFMGASGLMEVGWINHCAREASCAAPLQKFLSSTSLTGILREANFLVVCDVVVALIFGLLISLNLQIGKHDKEN